MRKTVMSRAKAPVFVVGCPRSGTTLLYDMLLSAGNFAVYLAESNVFNLLVPRFGDLSRRSNRKRLLEAWLQSKLFRASFLDAERLQSQVMEGCRSGGDFLRIVMGEIARTQGVERWADNSPEELLYTTIIKEQIPDSLFIHMIRDGRDVALSLNARPHPWIRPFSWDREKSLQVAGIFWEWIVTRGRKLGTSLGPDYIEIHFEDLLADPLTTLSRISEFISQDLDYDRISRTGIGSVSEPNTSFKGDAENPAGRWKKKIPLHELTLFEALVGASLRELGYPLGTRETCSSRSQVLRLRYFYRTYFDTKFWFKRSALGRTYLGPMSGRQIDNTVMGTDPAGEPVG